MPHSEDNLKFLCILKKRKDGGFDHYYNRKGNYWRTGEYLADYGFKDWRQLYDSGPETLEGFVACQMRPLGTVRMNERSGTLYFDADYDTPFERWKFNLRHQPTDCPLPDWVCVGEVRTECLRLLPEWADNHLVYHGRRKCEVGMAIVALRDSVISQIDGTTWTYGSATVFQKRCETYNTYLHDISTGFIRGSVYAYDHSWAEVSHSEKARAYGSATVILWPSSDGSLGTFVGYSPAVRIFRVKLGTITVPGQRVSEENLIPVPFNPQPEPVPYEAEESVNAPFH